MKGNEYNKIRGRQVEFVTEDVIEERFGDNSIPLSKIKELYELVIEVSTEEKYKIISYDKEHLPIITVVRDDGKQIFCSVIYNKDNKTITVEWNDAFNGYIYVL